MELSNFRFALFCTFIVVFASACGGGGGSGGGTPTGPGARVCSFAEPPPNFPDRTATFTPDGAASPNSIVLRPGANCTDLLILEVFANSVTDLARVRFDIGFPANLLDFDASRNGPFLGQSGTTQLTGAGGLNVDLQVAAGQPGVSGSGQIILVAWVYRGPTGSANISFQGQAFDSNGDEIAGTTFIGGAVNITL